MSLLLLFGSGTHAQAPTPISVVTISLAQGAAGVAGTPLVNATGMRLAQGAATPTVRP